MGTGLYEYAEMELSDITIENLTAASIWLTAFLNISLFRYNFITATTAT